MNAVYFKPEKGIKGLKCPSCGKPVNNPEFCNHCGASLDPRRRISVGKMYLAAVLVMVAGFGLLIYGYHVANYITPISAITADMDGVTVTVKGVVVDVDYDDRYERTIFTINDSSGNSIDVFGWSEFTSELKSAVAYPGIGDEIIVEGKVNVYTYSNGDVSISIEVDSLKSITVLYRAPESVKISELTAEDVGRYVEITGNVTYVYKGYSGTTLSYVFLKVDDGTENISVYIGNAQIVLAGDRFFVPEVGSGVRVIGMVSIYKETLEIIPSNATAGAIIPL